MNIYIQIISDLSHKNKYLTWYINIIENAQKRAKSRKEAKTVLEYCEGHHILPKSFNLGGEKDKLNFAYLTAREHFLVHLLMVKFLIHNNHKNKMSVPLLRMGKYHQNSRLYELARKFTSENSPSKEKEFQNKRRKTSFNKIGVSNHNQLIVVCPHCNKSGKKGGMMLSHFENCKENPDKIENLLTCPHCHKTGPKPNIIQYHLDFCKENPNRKSPTKKEYICPHCSKVGHNGSAMKQNHFDNCTQNPKTKRKLIICPYCNLTSYNSMSMTAYHFENCKLSPNYKSKIEIKIICPHCEKEGTKKSMMIRWHFDNCKNKII